MKKPATTEIMRRYLDETEAFLGRAASDPERNPVYVFTPWCKRCGICIALCPNAVLEAGPGGAATVVARPEECTRCRVCELHCPDFAITLSEKPKKGGA
jgi:2-oxoglutarate ferredoxin oxidoreductase subunit delta